MKLLTPDQRGLIAVVVLLLTCCAPATKKFYDGPTLPANDAATIVGQPGFRVYVDGRWVVTSALVTSGHHRIVVEGPQSVGYVELDASGGRSYTTRTMPTERGIRTWIVDREICAAVAGNPPENFDGMKPTDRGCVEEEPKPGETARGIIAIPLLLGAMYITRGQPITFPGKPAECTEGCYAEPDAREQPTSTLIVPPWREQAAEDCDAVFYLYLRCLTDMLIDGLRVRKNERRVLLSHGRHELAFKTVGLSGYGSRAYSVWDGLAFEARPDRVYALCVSRDAGDQRMRSWIVDQATGQVVSGEKASFDPDKLSGYSRHCPAY